MSSERVLHWKHLRGKDFQDLDRDQCVVTVSVSPLEVHGPHLPTITDNLEGEALLDAAMNKLLPRYPRMTHIKLPGVYVASDVLPHRGSINFRSSTVLRVVEDLTRSLVRQGFRHVWVSNFHGGPRHFVPLEVACHRVNDRYGGRTVPVFSLLLSSLTQGRTDLPNILGSVPGINRDDLIGDSHGGVVETSMLLHLLGEHVDPMFKLLPRMSDEDIQPGKGDKPKPSLAQLILAFRHKALYFQKHTYAGAPASASAEVGERILDVLSTHAADALAGVWENKIPLSAARSPLWPARHLLLAEPLNALIEKLIGFEQRVF